MRSTAVKAGIITSCKKFSIYVQDVQAFLFLPSLSLSTVDSLLRDLVSATGNSPVCLIESLLVLFYLLPYLLFDGGENDSQ